MAIRKSLAALTSLPLCITMFYGNAVAQGSTSSIHERATSGAPSTPTPMMNVTVQSFATQAAVIGKAEVALGELALERSKDSDVRAYAQRMVKDHTAANDSLQKLAVQENITLPNSLDSQHEAVRQKLASLHGEQFDRQYEREMAKGHDAAIALFHSATQSPQMPQEFKEFAAATLSMLEDHREQAQPMRPIRSSLQVALSLDDGSSKKRVHGCTPKSSRLATDFCGIEEKRFFLDTWQS